MLISSSFFRVLTISCCFLLTSDLQVIVLGAIGVLAGLVVTNKIELETLLGGASTALPKEKLSSHVKKKKKKKKKGKKRTIPKRTDVVEN